MYHMADAYKLRLWDDTTLKASSPATAAAASAAQAPATFSTKVDLHSPSNTLGLGTTLDGQSSTPGRVYVSCVAIYH
jgi:hypothetical protein